MCTSWRKAVVALFGAACVAALIYAQAVAGKPAKPPGGGGGTPPGTIYFQDHAPGFSGPIGVPQIFGMKLDGSGRFQALPDGVYAQPSNGTYGDDAHRWWLTVADISDDPDVIRRELYAVCPDSTDPTDPDKLTWVQLTDFFDPMGEGEFIAIDPGSFRCWVRWSNDGADTFVSFKGHDNRDDTDNIYRLPVKGTDLELLYGDFPPYGPDDPELEVVLTMPKEDGIQIKSLYNFTWSPDGNDLAFFTEDPRDALPYTLWVKSVVSDSLTDLGTSVWAGFWTDLELDWSPDGSRIVFVGRNGPSMWLDRAIWTVTPDGLEATVVRYFKFSIQGGVNYYSARWSPDGKCIAMQVVEGGTTGPWKCYIGTSPVDKWHLTLLPSDLDPATGKVPVAWVP